MKSGPSSTPADIERQEALPPRPVFGLRSKVLSILAAAALVPSLLVATFSYLTSREIVSTRVHFDVAQRASLVQRELGLWLDERASDSRVFANSFVVSENLMRWRDAAAAGSAREVDSARSRIKDYLAGVRARYPLYRALAVMDPEGTPIASSGDPGLVETLPAVQGQSWFARGGNQLLAYAASPVRSRDEEGLGFLIAVTDAAETWPRLTRAMEEHEVLRLVDERGVPLLDTRSPPPPLEKDLAGEATGRCLRREPGPAEYVDARGRRVLGSCRQFGGVYLIVEKDRDEALAAIDDLRQLNLLITTVAAGIAILSGFTLVTSYSRPIDALIDGARAVSRGDYSVQIPVLSRDEVGYLARVFNQMTRALRESHAALERQSVTDELTGLFNRRQLARAFAAELNRAERMNAPLAVMMIDLDHFKDFNDRLGHLEGDALLRSLGQFLTRSLRPTDVAVRYGGEEFLVLLPGTAKEQAGHKAESLRAEFQASLARDGGTSMSIGVATWPEDGGSEHDLVDRADGALYEAKRDGGNCVRLARAAAV